MSLLARQFRSERGDTIVEVMFAIAVFAFLAAGSLAVMNQGIATTQRSLEITQVRQAMNDQAELLRYAQQASLAGSSDPLWTNITKMATPSASTYGLTSAGKCVASTNMPAGAKPFVLYADAKAASPISIKQNNATNSPLFYDGAGNFAYPQIQGSSPGVFAGTHGLWIEAVRNPSTANYIDFHIRSCWDAPGSNQPVSLGTIVRLYTK